MAKKIDVAGTLHCVAVGNVLAGADEILDENVQKKQSQINAELIQEQEDLRDELDEKQGIITAVVTPTITEDDGDPAVESSFENGELTLAFKNLKGDKGEKGNKGDKGETGAQGESAIWDEAVPHEKLTDLVHTLGDSMVKPMSQKGVTDEFKKTAGVRDSETSADLDIADGLGNVLARFTGGHIKTKYFDSESAVLPSGNSIGNTDLDITDEQGNVLLRLGEGHVKTKYFDSANIKTDIFKRTNFVGSPSLYLPDYVSEDPVLFDNSAEVYAAYDELAVLYPQYFSAKGSIGMDESGTYDVNLYQLGWQNRKITNQRDGSGTNTYSETTQKPIRLLVCAGAHPNETPSIYGCWWGIKSILESNEPWAVWIKSNLILDIVPLMQPWGLNNEHVQNNANDVNINRTYFSNRQQENINMINLITDLMGKGLKGVIDCHNTGNTDNDGYLVSKPTYSYWYWYTELAQNISAMTNPLFEAVFGTTKNHFHCWDSSEFDGQLHDYVNSLGLLGCTFEIRKWLYNGSTTAPKPIVAQLTRVILINIINAFATFNDKR